jgi:hypothetical protein
MLWHIKTPEMTGTKSKFRLAFQFWLDSVPATGRNFSGISNLVFQRILPVVKMIDSPTQVETELHKIVPSLPLLKPFDLSIWLDHLLDTRCRWTPYTRIGFDVTLIHSTNDSSSSASEAA